MSEFEGWSSVPNWVIRSNKLQGSEKLLYIALLNRANSKGECWPSLATLENDSGVTKKTVLRKLEALEVKGLIRRVRRKSPDGRDMSNMYKILPFEEGVKITPQGVNEHQGRVEPLHTEGVNEHHEVLHTEVLPIRSTTQLSAREIEAAFEAAYSAWPKKVERKKSFEKFKQVCRKRDVNELVADIHRFADAYVRAGTEKRFVPALVVWLNGERWTDELPQPRGGSRVQQGMSVADELRAMEGRYAG